MGFACCLVIVDVVVIGGVGDVHLCVCVFVCARACVRACVRARVYVCVCVCVDIRMYMCVLVKESEEQIKLCKF